MDVSVIVPAHQEENAIDRCLRSVIGQSLAGNSRIRIEVIVLANDCSDATVAIARGLEPLARSRGLNWRVVDEPIGGKARALNQADRMARGAIRIYLDADIVCDPALFGELVQALEDDAALYASGALVIPAPRSWVSRCYARCWTRLPFVARDVAGCGLYAVNGAGRRRWGNFPALHSDDKYVRLLFSPAERRRVVATYAWPVPEGFLNLLRVRRRWCEGNAELRHAFPELRSIRRPGSLWEYARLVAEIPLSAMVFSAIYAGGALMAAGHERATPVKWRRGR